MFEFIKSKNFHLLFSFLLGVFIPLVLRPSCKGDHCVIHINPDLNELKKSTYQIGSKCYNFTPEAAVKIQD